MSLRSIDVVHAYWMVKANVSKSAVMVFATDPVEGSWKQGEDALPNISNIWAL